jgi:transposase
MVGKSKIVIEDHLTIEEINKLLKDIKIEFKLYKRLLFIKLVKQGKPISHAANFIGVTRETGFRWINQYNEYGLNGLIPKYAGGRPSFLTTTQFNDLKNILSDPDKNYSISEVQKIIKDKYNVNYSYKQVWEIVRKKLNLNYSKPFPVYETKPKNADFNLKKTQKK